MGRSGPSRRSRGDARLFHGTKCLARARAFDREYRIVRHSDGAVRWVHGLGRLDFDAQGQPVKMHGTIRDITERKQAEISAAREQGTAATVHRARAGGSGHVRSRDALSGREPPLAGDAFAPGPGCDRALPLRDFSRTSGKLEGRASPGAGGRNAARRREVALNERMARRNGSGGRSFPGGPATAQSAASSSLRRTLPSRRKTRSGCAWRPAFLPTPAKASRSPIPTGAILEVNEMFTRITGYSREEAMGQNPRLLKSGLQSEEFYANMWRKLARRGPMVRGDLESNQERRDICRDADDQCCARRGRQSAAVCGAVFRHDPDQGTRAAA